MEQLLSLWHARGQMDKSQPDFQKVSLWFYLQKIHFKHLKVFKKKVKAGVYPAHVTEADGFSGVLRCDGTLRPVLEGGRWTNHPMTHVWHEAAGDSEERRPSSWRLDNIHTPLRYLFPFMLVCGVVSSCSCVLFFVFFAQHIMMQSPIMCHTQLACPRTILISKGPAARSFYVIALSLTQQC